jgi:hypothetical protein
MDGCKQMSYGRTIAVAGLVAGLVGLAKSKTDREKEPTRAMLTVWSKINWQKPDAIHACD